MSATTLEVVRGAVRSLAAGGEPISNAQLYAMLGLTTEPEKVRMRRRIDAMLKRGELTRIQDGVFRYHPSRASAPKHAHIYTSLWRFVRKAKPGWDIKECSLLTGVSYTTARRYCLWLEEEGFVARAGKNGTNLTYRSTSRADQTPETPWPPGRESDPFERERAAAALIARLMLCENLYSGRTARRITEACNTLLSRFGGNHDQSGNQK